MWSWTYLAKTEKAVFFFFHFALQRYRQFQWFSSDLNLQKTGEITSSEDGVKFILLLNYHVLLFLITKFCLFLGNRLSVFQRFSIKRIVKNSLNSIWTFLIISVLLSISIFFEKKFERKISKYFLQQQKKSRNFFGKIQKISFQEFCPWNKLFMLFQKYEVKFGKYKTQNEFFQEFSYHFLNFERTILI